MSARVIIVGGGVAGLSAATFLAAARPDLELLVLEASARAGGNVQSDREDGRVLDRAANGWLDNEPAMGRLLALAGLVAQPVGDGFGTRWIWADGLMQRAPLSPPAMIQTRLLSFGAKLRLLLEPFLPRGGSEDESVSGFVRRRLGQAAVDRLVGPMVAGVYGADPDQLSLKAAFPRMAELEKEHRSLFIAMLRLRRGGAPPGLLHSLPDGAGGLPEALAARLGARLQTSTPVTAVEPRRGRWLVHTAEGAEEADAVVLAAPAHATAPMLRGLDPELARALEDIRYAPLSVVITASPRGAWRTDPHGFGVLFARGEAARAGIPGVLGTVFTSTLFPNQAREGEVLLRTMIGGAASPEAAEQDSQALTHLTRRAHALCFGEERVEPHFVRIYRHPRAIPLYAPGHLGRVRSLRAGQTRYPGLFFIGNHTDGIGVKDCARQGEQASALVSAHLPLGAGG